MKTLDKILAFFEYGVNGVFLVVMVLVMSAQIITRFLGMPLSWSEELARYMFIWLIYLSVSQAAREGRHLSVDILPIFLKERGKAIIHIISNIFCIIFFVMIFYFGMQVTGKLIERPQLSQAMHMNMIIPYAAPYLGGLLTALRLMLNTVETVISLKNGSYVEKKEEV